MIFLVSYVSFRRLFPLSSVMKTFRVSLLLPLVAAPLLFGALASCGKRIKPLNNYEFGEIPEPKLFLIKRNVSGTVYLDDGRKTFYPVNLQDYKGGETVILGSVFLSEEGSEGFDATATFAKKNGIPDITYLPTLPLSEGKIDYAALSIEEPDKIVCPAPSAAMMFPSQILAGYLVLHINDYCYRSHLGRHRIELFKGQNPDNPYELHLIHKAGAGELTAPPDENSAKNCLVAFDLSSLPSTSGKTTELRIVCSMSLTDPLELDFSK